MRASQDIDRRKAKGLPHLDNQEGIAVPLVAVTLVAIIALASVGVDTGRVAMVATEVQTAAEVAATAATINLADGGNPQTGANQALGHNTVNGAPATQATLVLEQGHFDPSYNFTAGGLPTNAVRARVTTVLNNILLGAIGVPVSTITREAIATFGGLGAGTPTLPIVLGECHFNPNCMDQSCMPYLSQVPSPSDNSGWTGFFETASNNTILSYMPAAPGCSGGGRVQPIKVGDIINLNNGQTTPLLNAVKCAVDSGIRIFTIPIVPCGHQYNQSAAVRGFAKIEVDSVRSSGNPKGIWLHGIWEGQQPGPPGGGLFGLNAVSLVK